MQCLYIGRASGKSGPSSCRAREGRLANGNGADLEEGRYWHSGCKARPPVHTVLYSSTLCRMMEVDASDFLYFKTCCTMSDAFFVRLVLSLSGLLLLSDMQKGDILRSAVLCTAVCCLFRRQALIARVLGRDPLPRRRYSLRTASSIGNDTRYDNWTPGCALKFCFYHLCQSTVAMQIHPSATWYLKVK